MKNIYNSGFEFILAYPNLNGLNPQNTIKVDNQTSSSDSLYVYFGVTLLVGILAGL
jgi:hypothetical protein